LRYPTSTMKTALTILCLIALALNSDAFGTEQRVIVKGRLICGDRPATGVKVKLYDIDTGSDDLMGNMTTSSNGEFMIDGKTSELGTIDPMLKIYHNCHDSKPCDRRVRLDIPTDYIAKSGAAPKTFDIGTWNLQAVYKEEDKDCIH